MSSFRLPPSKINPPRHWREIEDLKKDPCILTPWTVINIVYEICETHLLSNSAHTIGLPFDQKYDRDYTKSDIALEIAYDWKGKAPQKRPAVFITRGPATYAQPTIGQTIGASNVAEAEEGRGGEVEVPVSVVVIANGVGMTELFAEYMRYPFLYFSKELCDEYCFSRLRLVRIGAPAQVSSDAKEAFSIELSLDIRFFDRWTTKADTLKLKTLGSSLYVSGDDNNFDKQ